MSNDIPNGLKRLLDGGSYLWVAIIAGSLSRPDPLMLWETWEAPLLWRERETLCHRRAVRYPMMR